jgi:uncharacterized membrane protein YiaA
VVFQRVGGRGDTILGLLVFGNLWLKESDGNGEGYMSAILYYAHIIFYATTRTIINIIKKIKTIDVIEKHCNFIYGFACFFSDLFLFSDFMLFSE